MPSLGRVVEKATGTPHGKPDTPSNVARWIHRFPSSPGLWSKSGGSDGADDRDRGQQKTVDGTTSRSVRRRFGQLLADGVDIERGGGDHASSGGESFSLLTVPMPISAPRLGHRLCRSAAGLGLMRRGTDSPARADPALRLDVTAVLRLGEISDGAVIRGGISARTYYFCQVGTATSGTPVSSSPVSAGPADCSPRTCPGVTIAKSGPRAVTIASPSPEAYPAITSMTVTVGGKTRSAGHDGFDGPDREPRWCPRRGQEQRGEAADSAEPECVRRESRPPTRRAGSHPGAWQTDVPRSLIRARLSRRVRCRVSEFPPTWTSNTSDGQR